MGGYGSGRRASAADCTEDYRGIDVRRFQRDRLLQPGRAFVWRWTSDGETVASVAVRIDADRVNLAYRHRSGGDWREANYPIPLDWTACHYGGRRAWFLCPGSGCSRRVAILYAGAVFACRHCYGLAYACQREAPHDRVARRAEKIRTRLQWEPGILNGEGSKPKGMRWRTFNRLIAQHDALTAASLAAMLRFGL